MPQQMSGSIGMIAAHRTHAQILRNENIEHILLYTHGLID